LSGRDEDAGVEELGDRAFSVAAADADAGFAAAACAKQDDRVKNVRRHEFPDCGCDTRQGLCENASHGDRVGFCIDRHARRATLDDCDILAWISWSVKRDKS